MLVHSDTVYGLGTLKPKLKSPNYQRRIAQHADLDVKKHAGILQRISPFSGCIQINGSRRLSPSDEDIWTLHGVAFFWALSNMYPPSNVRKGDRSDTPLWRSTSTTDRAISVRRKSLAYRPMILDRSWVKRKLIGRSSGWPIGLQQSATKDSLQVSSHLEILSSLNFKFFYFYFV